MNRMKISAYNAISSLILTLVNGLGGLILTSMVIKVYGSDFNGVNATVTQIVNVLLLIEGGFTLAANVALFKPYNENDLSIINSIMTATRQTFKKMGMFVFVGGIIIGFIYSFIIKSELNFWIIFSIFVMTTISVSFNLGFTTKYRLMFQVEQKEYVSSITSIITYILTYVVNFCLIYFGYHMLTIRISTMFFSLMNGLIIYFLYRKQFNYIDMYSVPGFQYIKGTKDVLVQKLTSIVYSTSPVLFISSFVSTLMTSVYAVYNSVFVIIKSILSAITNAPTLSFGDLISNKTDKDTIYKLFVNFENIILICTIIILLPTANLIIPFVKLYTSGIKDIDYINYYIPLLMVLITLFETIHLPSGIIINMSGHFKISKYIQLITVGILMISLIAGYLLFNIYGILLSVLIAAITLCVLEITYVYRYYFKKNIRKRLFVFIANISVFLILFFLNNIFLPNISNYFQFFLFGFLILIISILVILVFNYYINKETVLFLFSKAKDIFLKFK